MSTDQRRAYAAQIKRLTDHGQHQAAYRLWEQTISPKAAPLTYRQTRAGHYTAWDEFDPAD
jgi:hypothetical protein